MLQMIDTANYVRSLLRRKTVNGMLLSKRPQGIARLNTDGLIGNVRCRLGICGVTSAEDRGSKYKEERERNGQGDNRRGLQSNGGRSRGDALAADGLSGQCLKTRSAAFDNRESRRRRRLELKGEVSLDHIRCIHHVLLSRFLTRTVLSSREDKKV